MRTEQPRNPSSGPSFKEFLPTILLAASIVLSAFVAYPGYYSLTAEKETFAAVTKEKASREAELATLDALKTQSSVPAYAADLSRYASAFREDAILASLFGGGTGILPLSIGMEKGTRLPNGLSMADINLTLRATSQASFMKYLEYLTGNSSQKRYVVKTANFPFDSTSPKTEPFQVTVTLGLYYYSK